jgi:uncharacterized tellurite resistance protein B-like protein
MIKTAAGNKPTMNDNQHQRLMLKILIGSAWADRHLEPPEVAYLSKVLTRFHGEEDVELQALLKAPVALEQTENWLVAYLQNSPESERLKLLAAIGNLLMADNVVSGIEHDLLDEFHELMALIPAPPEPLHEHEQVAEVVPSLAKKVGQFCRRVMAAAQHLAQDH